MKKIIPIIFTVVLLSNFLYAQNEFEPNDVFGDAATIACDSNYESYIQNLGDKDWFEVNVSQPGVLKVQVNGVPNNLDLNLLIYQVVNGLPKIIAYDNDTNANGGQNVEAKAFVTQGNYLISITDESNNAFSNTESYNLVVTCLVDNFEINQTIDLAKLIPQDTCFEASIYGENHCYFTSNEGANDQEWYQVNISETGYLRAAVTSVPSNLGINLTIHQIINGQPKVISDDNAGGGQSLTSVAYVEAGTYYINLNDESNNATNQETFTFCSNFFPNQTEINQIIDSAFLIPQDTCFEEEIWGENLCFFTSNEGANDQEWYQVNISETGYLRAAVTSVPSNLIINLTIHQIINGQPKVISDDNDDNAGGGQSLTSVAYVEAGTYYINLNDESNNATNQETFTFCLSFFPNETETNQIIDFAFLIPQDTCFEEEIWGENLCFFNSNEGANDQEWYRVNINYPGKLVVRLTSVPNNLDLNIGIYQIIDNQPTLISCDNDDNAGGGQSLTSVAYIETGTYYIKINDESNNATNQETFTFCIEFLPDDKEINQTIDLAIPLISTDTCFEEDILGDNKLYFTTNEGDDDQDWYSFTISTPCTLSVNITDVPANLDLNLELFTIVNGQHQMIDNDGDSNASGGQSLFMTTILDAGTYYIHIEDESNNGQSFETFTVCIQLGTQVSFSPPDTIFCIDDAPTQLEGVTPIGGVFSGDGVNSSGIFDPSMAGVGIHEIVYTFTDPSLTCSGSATATITVNDLPSVSLSFAEGFCIDDIPTQLTDGTPVGGTYSGAGINANGVFDASVAGVGTHPISYSYINPTTLCSNTTSSMLTVHALPIVSLISSVDTVLITDTPFALSGTPGGGLFQGNGINSGGVFDLAIAGIGSH
ncbi:MAG: hypothetical protein ACI85O_001013, partial [Saprospiraceae bacterium]